MPLSDEQLVDLIVLFDADGWSGGEHRKATLRSLVSEKRRCHPDTAARRLRTLKDLGFLIDVGGDVVRLEVPEPCNSAAVATTKMSSLPPLSSPSLTPFEGSKAKEESKGKVIVSAPFKGSKGDFAPLEAVMAQLGALIDGDGVAGRLEKRTRLRDWIKNYFERHGDRSTHEAVCGRMADAVLDNGLPAKKVLAEAVDAIAAAAAKGDLGNAGALATQIFRRHGYPLARSPPRKSK